MKDDVGGHRFGQWIGCYSNQKMDGSNRKSARYRAQAKLESVKDNTCVDLHYLVLIAEESVKRKEGEDHLKYLERMCNPCKLRLDHD